MSSARIRGNVMRYWGLFTAVGIFTAAAIFIRTLQSEPGRGVLSPLPVAASAQEQELRRAQQAGSEPLYLFHNFTPPGTINDIAFAGNYVWAATSKGAVRWNRLDGSYKLFTTADGLAGNHVLSVAVDQAGSLWFGTLNAGLSRLAGNSWTTFTTAHGLPDNAVSVILPRPNGTLILGTFSGAVSFSGTRFVNLPPGGPTERITAVAVDNNQHLWLGTYDSGSYRLSGNIWSWFGNPNTGPGGGIRDIQVAANGDIWFALNSHGVGRISGNTWTRFTTANGLVNNYPQSLAIDNAGTVWAAFSDGVGGGIGTYSAGSWSTINVRQQVGLNNSYVNKVRRDAGGQLWFGADNYLFTRQGSSWPVYLAGLPITPLQRAPEMAVAPNGDVWFSVTRVGVVRYDGTTWKLFTRANGLAGEEVLDIVVDAAGEVWLAVYTETFSLVGVGVNRYDGTNWTIYNQTSGLGSNAVNGLAAAAGKLWAGTENGLSVFNGTAWTTYRTADGLLANRVGAIGVHGDNVWFGYSYAPNLTHYDGADWTHYPTVDTVAAIDFDALGNPWASGDRDLRQFNGVDWDSYPVAIDAPTSYTTDLVVDAGGDVWLGAYGSVSWIGLARFRAGNWINFTTANGLLNDGVQNIAINPARNEIWFNAADDGVTRLRLVYGLDDKVYLPLLRR